jgi:hypothetical protein
MRTALKIRTFLLLVAVLFTGLALSHPGAIQACTAYTIYDCQYENGVWCRYHDCPKYAPSCDGTPSGSSTCYWAGDECCPGYP